MTSESGQRHLSSSVHPILGLLLDMEAANRIPMPSEDTETEYGLEYRQTQYLMMHFKEIFDTGFLESARDESILTGSPSWWDKVLAIRDFALENITEPPSKKEIDSEDPRLLYLLFDAYMRRDDLDKATDIGRRLTRLSKPLAFSWYLYGHVHMKRKQYLKAIQVFEEGLRRFPGHPMLHFLVGECHLTRRAFKRARPAFEQALEFAPDFEGKMPTRETQISSYIGLATISNHYKDYDQTRAYLSDAIERFPDEMVLYVCLFKADFVRGDYEQALSVALQMVALQTPERTEDLELIIQALIKIDDAERGESILSSLVNSTDRRMQSLYYLLLCSFRIHQGDLEGAVEAFDTARDLGCMLGVSVEIETAKRLRDDPRLQYMGIHIDAEGKKTRKGDSDSHSMMYI